MIIRLPYLLFLSAVLAVSCSAGDDDNEDATVSATEEILTSTTAYEIFQAIDFSLPSSLSSSTALQLADRPPPPDGVAAKERPSKGKNGAARGAGNPPSQPKGSGDKTKGIGSDNKGTPGSIKDRPAPSRSAPEADDKSIIERRAQRIERILTRLNEVLNRLKTDVDGTGSFSDKGPDGKISGVVEAGGDLDYEAIICHDQVQFMYLQFSSDGSQVYTVRDFAVSPMGNSTESTETTSFYSSLYYVTYDGTEKYLTINNFGTPWKKPNVTTDGDDMAGYTVAAIDASNNFVIQSIVDFFDASAITSYAPSEADGYMVGVVPGDSSIAGYSVGYLKNKDACSGSFDEAGTAPGWCLGQQIGSTTPFTTEELATKWSELQNTYSASIQGYTNLAEVSLSGLSSGTTCPANTGE